MPENRSLRIVRRLLWLGLLGIGLWLAVHLLLPFLAALGLAALMEPAGVFLTRKGKMSRRWAAGLCTAALAGGLLGGLGLLLWRGWYELTVLLDRLPTMLARLTSLSDGLESRLYRFLIALPSSVRQPVKQALRELMEQGSGLPTRLYQWLTEVLTSAAAVLPAVGLFTVTTLLAAYLFSADRPRLGEWIRRSLPEPWRPRLGQAGDALKSALGSWLRAQLLLMLITFGELTAGLLLLRVELALLLAGLIALLDALPVFGAAVILVPWGLGALLTGQTLLGVGLLVLCGVVTLMRSFLEPRLIGHKTGLHPLAALVSMYAGFQAFGVAGMILAPLLAVVAKQLWDSGLLRELWSLI